MASRATGGERRRLAARAPLILLSAVGALAGCAGEAVAPAPAAPRAEAVTPASMASAGLSRHPNRPNVLVYLIDTLRSDALGCYGNPRPLSPHLDALARSGIVFERAVAQSSWTQPSVASVFTGVSPLRHGVHRIGDALAAEAVTLAELLRAAGYRTHGVIGNSSVARTFGFDQGFAGYGRPGGRWWSGALTRAAVEWLDTSGGAGPFFLYVHTVDPHAPYDPPREFRRRLAPAVPADGRGKMHWLRRLAGGEIPVTPSLREDLRALYDAEVAANDASFGALAAALEQRGLWQDLVVVVLSDHGEEFFEHAGWDHGKTLYGEVLDVPLVVRLPGLPEGRRVREIVQHVDLLPTLLSYLGLPVPAGLDGRDLLPLAMGEEGVAAAPGAADDGIAFSYLDNGVAEASAVTRGRWRYLEWRAPDRRAELFDRQADPGERHDLLARRPIEAAHLSSLLRARERMRRTLPDPTPAAAVLDEALLAELRALGYVGPAAAPARARPAGPAEGPADLWFRGDFESGDLAGWGGDLPRAASATVVSAPAPVRRGRHAVRITLAPGDRAARKERAELRLEDRTVERSRGGPGQTLWYGWSLLVPADHVDPPGGQFPILAQWHHRTPGGEVSGPPPLALYLVPDGTDHRLTLIGQESPAAPPRTLATRPIRKGVWVDLVLRVTWSTGDDGAVTAWLDGQPFTDGAVPGRTLYNPLSNYLRLGFYRRKGGSTTNHVFFDEVRIGGSFAAVAP